MRAPWLIAALCLASGARALPPPFKTADEQPIEYLGPGRDEAEPEVAEVRVAWFGPGEEDAVARPFWRGALLAQEEENEAGGYRGKPFRLLPAWSAGPWGAAVVSLTRRVFDDGVWAVLGGIDGASTHLAEQVAVKTGITIVSPGGTDPTVHTASSPWMFSLAPDDEALAGALARGLSTRGTLVIAAAAEHDASVASRHLRHALAERHLAAESVVEVSPRDADYGPAVERLLASEPTEVLVVAPAEPAGRLVAALRQRGFRGAILGSAPLATTAFRHAAGRAAEDVVVPIDGEHGAGWDAFAVRYARRFGEPAEATAGYGYDAMRLVVDAVRHAGLNRVRLRDAVRESGAWRGVTGAVRWDARGRNRKTPVLGVWKGARVVAGGAP